VALSVILALLVVQASHPVRAQTMTITIQNFAFSPATITIPAGTTVTWTNEDSAAHTATSDSGVWDSGTLMTGQSYSRTFDQPGTYPYHCMIHPFMKATIIVQSAGTVGATATAPSSVSTVPAATATTPGSVSTVPAATATSIPLAAYPAHPVKRSHSLAHKTVLTKEVNGAYAFVAKKLTIKVGTKVTWKNVSDAPHTITGKGTWKVNLQVVQGKSVSVVFKKPGTYHYYCVLHPYMQATIVVKR
jgi:plastocyanin